jgi:hypothetical protein
MLTVSIAPIEDSGRFTAHTAPRSLVARVAAGRLAKDLRATSGSTPSRLDA